MVATARRADRVLLHNISWEQFERLLTDLGESRSAHIAYDNGMLEIMTPLPEHEDFKEVIGHLSSGHCRSTRHGLRKLWFHHLVQAD
jgi:Uma2 family endonuclease